MSPPPPSPTRTCRVVCLIASAFVLLGASAAVPLEPNLQKLRQLPPERRRQLLENLQEFDALPHTDQEQIRTLHQQVLEADPAIRRRYYDVLHRYRVWLDRLAEDQRQALTARPAAERMALVRQYLAQGPSPASVLPADLLARVSSLHAVPLFDQVHWIRCWFALTPAQRVEVERAQGPARLDRLEQLGREQGVGDDRAEFSARLLQESPTETAATEKDATSEPDDASSAEPARPPRRLLEARFLSSYVPEPVAPENLDRFTHALPSWLLEPLDPLPPEAARLRRVILYRLAFPAPQEIPGAAAETPRAPASAPGPAPARSPSPPPAPGVTPF